MSQQQPPNCCQWCVGFSFTLGITALMMWLSLRPSQPTYSIEKFYVPALNKTADDPTNTTITFAFKLSNPNKDSRVYYDSFNITFYHSHNLSLPIGNISTQGFRQGHKKKATKIYNFTAVGVPWKTAMEEISTGKNTTVFRVDFQTTIRYRTLFVMSKRKQMKIGRNVTVNNQGMKSKASVHGPDCMRLGFLLLFVWILSPLLCMA